MPVRDLSQALYQAVLRSQARKEARADVREMYPLVGAQKKRILQERDDAQAPDSHRQIAEVHLPAQALDLQARARLYLHRCASQWKLA